MRALAFFLPQFHPIPQNDAWWGAGFTEWTNVTKARPLFPGHYQPHLPADLGFYDLRLPETRAAQAQMAREHGLHGFCYYHYWFNGQRVLERPVNDIVSSGQPDFPFCLCWANENWSRRWDGLDRELLLEQVYSPEDDVKHIQTLLPIFKDQRYIKVNGKPFFLVYRITHLPEPAATIGRWQAEAKKAGLPGLFVANVESFKEEHGAARKFPLDAAVEFAPDWERLPKLLRKSCGGFGFFSEKSRPPYTTNRIYRYLELIENMEQKTTPDYLRFPCVTPMWDNAARRKENATVFIDSTPELYKKWLEDTARKFHPPSAEEDFIFINAWNEWAEGNHLEPCQKWGRGYLEATKAALSSVK